MEDLIGRQLGDYQIIEQIGKGGMASVYRAFQPSLERDVAIKVLPPYYAQQDESFTQRFRREAKAIANLRHPNILMVMEAGEQDDLAYMVMEYVNAGTLKERLQKPITLKEIYNLVKQIASALEHAHEQGVVHRDIKPSNIMLPKPDWALLTDFGLAHMVGGSLLTQSGMTVGTPAYMSPEQGRGERVDHRTDIYSLGIMLYEMTVGEVPYTAETPMAVVVKHIIDPLPIPRDKNPDIPEELQRIILKALAKNPEDRFQSADEMAASLERVALTHPDWSVTEMKAVNTIRTPREDQPETFQIDEQHTDADLAEDPTLQPPVELAPAAVPADSQPAAASDAQLSKPKKKRRWPLIVGGILLFLFCAFIGLAAIANIFGEGDTAELNSPDNLLYADEIGDPGELAMGAEPGEELAAEGEFDPVMLEEFDRIGELVEQGDIEKAQEVYRQVAERFPRVWEFFIVRRVEPLIEQGEIEQALYLLEAGLAVNPEAPPEAFERAGFLYWELEQPLEALHALERSAIHHPWYVPAYRDIEFVAADNDGRLIPNGIEILEGLREHDPREGALHLSLGNLYFYHGQEDQSMMSYHQAKDRFRALLAEDKPNNMVGWNTLGLAAVLFYIEEDLDSLDDMLAEVERIGFKERDQRLLEELAWLYVEMGECGKVTRLFAEVENKFPEFEPHLDIGMICP